MDAIMKRRATSVRATSQRTLRRTRSGDQDRRAPALSWRTYYRWRTEFGGLKLDQVKRLKELERENARLRKAVSDLTLEKVILKEAASGKW